MGLLRGMARTAVVAGTATAVSNRVSRRQLGRWQHQDEAPPPVAPPAAAPSAPDDMSVKLEQLRQLAELKEKGLLTEAEVERQKALILG